MIEARAGLGLLGAEISVAAIPLGRVAGTALLAVSIACWLASGDTKNRAARGLNRAMLLYNLGVAVVLAVAGIQSRQSGIALWPASSCTRSWPSGGVACLRRKPAH